MKVFSFGILLILASALVSCSSTEEPRNVAATENNPPAVSNSSETSEQQPEMEKPDIPETFEMKEVYPVKTYSQKTPREAFETFVKATINKDAEGVKRSLSDGSMAFIEESAEAQNVSVDAILLNENTSSFTDIPEVKNEKIKGDTATVEVKNKTTGKFEEMPLVKEDGEWRVALDKFMENLMKKLTEDMKKPPAK